ncbi:response regulator [Clostridium estertheticum]|uniref:Stage 0 sporulation protein A homolog n=1 Tax=Clostridium estertheticum TaxID=238834 RepID=A0A5N7ILT1_9CLOT|nr:response regulator [Clostridium estertheticum]MPQ31270.1 response regulator [Clostridium estertheticum]MPQ61944.1 response regulator [Clostridium estertheticum]
MFKVLIAEDEEMIRKGLRYTFDWNKADCIVVGEACNGIEGIEKIKELDPDILIVDINMPIMNGITMIQNSKEEFSYSAIVLSGYDEFDLAKQAIHLGVMEYLLKPVDNNQLFEALEKAKKQIIKSKYYKISEIKSRELIKFDVLQGDFIRDVHKSSKCVSQMVDYVKESYHKKISIQDLVDILCMSSTHLNQKFKQETSFTFNDYVNRYRINMAINIMKTGKGKIYTIAMDVGFKDYRYFINVFKKYTNCLPSDFIEYFRE